MPVTKQGLNDGQFFPVHVSLLASSFPKAPIIRQEGQLRAVAVSVNFAQSLSAAGDLQRRRVGDFHGDENRSRQLYQKDIPFFAKTFCAKPDIETKDARISCAYRS